MKKLLLKAVGLFFVGLAILGAFLPLLPTTPFLLISALCFAKSSPRLYNKLLANKTFGPLIYHWRKNKSIPKKAKLIALLTMVLAVSWSVYLMESLWLQWLVVLLVAGPFIFVARLPIAKDE